MGSSENEASFDKIARGVLDHLLEGCQVIGPDWRYLYVNDSVARQGGRSREELLGRTMMECYPGIDATAMFAVLRRCMTERVHDRMDNEFRHLDGSIGWFELRFVPVPEGVCILSLDTTSERRARDELRKTEDQLRHSQKMEAVGRLAGGVAHDFNNLLSVVLSYAELCLDNLEPSSPIRADIAEIEAAASRAASLTRQLLTFSRRQVVETRIVDLGEIVAGMERMLRRVLGEDVRVVVSLAPELARIRADPGQIEQVVMNLVVNARDAMPAGGRLTIETADVELDAGYSASHLGVGPGPYVMLAVSDTGIGMDKDTQEHVFEPFFTTKGPGKGTGLGLSTVFGIVQQSGGSIWLYSEVGHGTTFKIYFPRTDALETSPRVAVEVATLRGSETILLVEDDDALRALAKDILERSGYQVLAAHGGAEALAICGAHTGTIALLLTDVVMPNMSGREVAARATSLRPGLRVLYMSGYTDDALAPRDVGESGARLLQKPITPTSLLRRVREAIEEPTS